jgi:phosphodiesterase/alkaline phosphatase D-like protein
MAQLIIGHVTTKAAKIWIRGIGAQTSATAILADSEGHTLTNANIELSPDNYRTAVTVFDELQADKTYTISVVFNHGTEVKGSFVTMPSQTDEFSFLLGSCHFSLAADHKSPEFKRIHEIANLNNSRFMINCGDQMYIDAVFLPFWVNGENDYAERYSETWHAKELRDFFANMPQYMILDDHEVYNNFVNENLSIQKQQWFAWAERTYRLFQHSHNPDSGSNLYYQFECAHGAFFVMDIRTERTSSRMVSEEQMTALLNWIANLEASNKVLFIVSPVPVFTQLIAKLQTEKWSGSGYAWQRNRILKMLMLSENKKVVFLSGDIHLASHATISYEANGKTQQLHELISSPIKQISANVLSHNTTQTVMIDGVSLKYKLEKHMGLPFENIHTKHHLRNNVMSISVKRNSLVYKVYALNNSKPPLFEEEIFFD